MPIEETQRRIKGADSQGDVIFPKKRSNDLIEGECSVQCPNVHGWIERKLTQIEIDHINKCIDDRDSKRFNHSLAGNISASYEIFDKENKFYNKTLIPLIDVYEKNFGASITKKIPINTRAPMFLERMWVNYQYQHEFNPTHDHTGLYSFVIWLNIPTEYEHQANIKHQKETNAPKADHFQFQFVDILGDSISTDYALSKGAEGMMLFFPAKLKHQVYPFYDNDGERISVSGNISLDTERAARERYGSDLSTTEIRNV